MVKKIESVTYEVEVETPLNLEDGSFIEPEIVRRWAQALLAVEPFYYISQGGHAGYVGLTRALEEKLRRAVDDKTAEGSDVREDIDVSLEGDYHPPQQDLTEIVLGSPLMQYEMEDEAQQAELRFQQEQAFASYRIADHMVQAVKAHERLERAKDDLIDAQKSFDRV